MNDISRLITDIKVFDECNNWEDSVRISTEGLVASNCIKEKYVDEIINSVNKNGPYFVIMDDVALPHCSKLELVNETSISILKLKKGVMFPGDKSVRLLISLAAKEGKEHMKLLSDLTELLMDDEKMKVILESEDAEEIRRVIESV